MDRLTERQKQAIQTRKRIQDAAFELFEEYGYDNVSMREIAEKADCSIGNLYHYFKDKDALILKFTDHVDEVYDEIATQIPSELNSIEKLQWFMTEAIIRSNDEKAISLGFSQALKHPELGTLDLNSERQYYQIIRGLIEDAKKDGFIDLKYTSKSVIRGLIALQRGLLVQWRIEQGKFVLRPVAEKMISALLVSLSY